jgi:hypothetical protein
VATAIADGDLTRKITVEAQGEILQIKEVINAWSTALRLRRRGDARGPRGGHGGRARAARREVPGRGGTWKDLTDSVNFMASNLTSQVRTSPT